MSTRFPLKLLVAVTIPLAEAILERSEILDCWWKKSFAKLQKKVESP